MKTRAEIYGNEATDLLRIVTMYPGLCEHQLLCFHPGAEEGRQAQPPRQKQKGEQQRPPRPEKQPKAPAAPSPASDGTAALPTGEKKRPHRRRYRGKPKGDRPQGPKPES